MRKLPERLVDAAHLAGLVAFAVGQPLFDALAHSPEFFLARKSAPIDVLLVTLALSVLLPAVLVLAEGLAGLAGAEVRRRAHRTLVAVLVATTALPPLHRTLSEADAAWPLAAASAIGVLFAVAYARRAALRLFVTVLTPAALVFPALFLLRPPISLVVRPPHAPVVGEMRGDAPPVVMLVLDEFPLSALLDARGEIDTARFPHFAALAREATWFRNATTVADITYAALPALLTGTYPDRHPLLRAANRTHNLFSLLAGSHELHVNESYVPFCAENLCGQAASRPPLSVRLQPLMTDVALFFAHLALPGDLARAVMQIPPHRPANRGAELVRSGDAVRHLIDEIGPSAKGRPALRYLHAMLPHEPHLYLPSGRLCARRADMPPDRLPADEFTVARLHERMLLQVGYVDTLIGRLIERLRETGLYDEVLLVVTGDHGASYRPGAARRALTQSNYCDILRVPLFLKAPHQRTGGPVDRNVELVDVLPTMASLLGVPIPWRVDGASALDGAAPARSRKVVIGPYFRDIEPEFFAGAERVMLPPSLAELCADLDRKRFPLGSGSQPGGRFALGPWGNLLGAAVAELRPVGRPAVRIDIDHTVPHQNGDTGRESLPCDLTGSAVPLDGTVVGGAGIALAVAVNGRIEAVTYAQRQGKNPAFLFSATLPESALRLEDTPIEVFAVSGSPRAPVLTPTVGSLMR